MDWVADRYEEDSPPTVCTGLYLTVGTLVARTAAGINLNNGQPLKLWKFFADQSTENIIVAGIFHPRLHALLKLTESQPVRGMLYSAVCASVHNNGRILIAYCSRALYSVYQQEKLLAAAAAAAQPYPTYQSGNYLLMLSTTLAKWLSISSCRFFSALRSHTRFIHLNARTTEMEHSCGCSWLILDNQPVNQPVAGP